MKKDKNKKDYLIQVLKIGLNKNFKILLMLVKNMEKIHLIVYKKLLNLKHKKKYKHMLNHFGKE